VLVQALFDRPQVGRLADKVVRCTLARAGNQATQWRRKYWYRPVSVSIPRNSPTPSMVRTSLSARVGWGPRWRRGWGWLASQSSIRQNTVTMKVVTSMARPSCGAVMASPAAYEGLGNPLRKPAHRVSYLALKNGAAKGLVSCGNASEQRPVHG
jgi:hypothetical protein